MEIYLIWPDITYIHMLAKHAETKNLKLPENRIIESGKSSLLNQLLDIQNDAELKKINICVPYIAERRRQATEAAILDLKKRFPGLRISWFLVGGSYMSKMIMDKDGIFTKTKIDFFELAPVDVNEKTEIQVQYCLARAFLGKKTGSNVVFDTEFLRKAIKICQDENEIIKVPEYFRTHRPGMEGSSHVMKILKQRIFRYGPSLLNVLISGESGSGKEATAFFLHDLSPARENKFTAVNCSVFTEETLVSELFGHEAGAFTGASKKREGRIRKLNGGTLFLDELPEMPAKGQALLLRFLEDGEIMPLGADEPVKTKHRIRVIAAGQPDLLKKKVRKDLLYRLEGARIHVPPLREMKEDMLAIVDHYCYKKRTLSGEGLSPSERYKIKDFFSEHLALFQEHKWPGNIREFLLYINRRIEIGEEEEEEIINQIRSEIRQGKKEGRNSFSKEFETLIARHRNNLPSSEYLKCLYTHLVSDAFPEQTQKYIAEEILKIKVQTRKTHLKKIEESAC